VTKLHFADVDAIQSFVQLDKESGGTIRIGPFVIREAHIQSVMQSAADESSREAKYGYLTAVLGCMAKLRPNQ